MKAAGRLQRVTPGIGAWVRDRPALAAWARDVLLPFAATRAMLTVVGLLSLAVLPRRGVPARWDIPSSYPLITEWSRWDGYWYVRIANEGYSYVPGGESAVAFFPLYPTLMRLGGILIGRTDPPALAFVGIVISNVLLLAALSCLWLLVRMDFDEETAARTLLYLLVFPATLFLSAVYPESLFLALSVGALYCARTERWWIAGLLGGLATLTRPHGLLLAAPLLAEYAIQRGFSLRPLRLPALRPDVLSFALIPAGLLVFAVFLEWRFGEPLAWAHAQYAGWGRGFKPPWETLRLFFSTPLRVHSGNHSLVDLASAILFVLPVAASWRFLRPSYALLTTVFFVGALSSGLLLSLMRLEVTLFPAFMVLAIWGRQPWFDRLYLAVSTGLAGLFMAMFAQWYWVA